ncbi:hypothetical protein [Altericroceibacterium endophyticum]|uniref:Uncharacterized protein n=1 Tax=Altericroceibacterium endophyticum TaxID=1808508 RepID=A0A6I4TA57_9SPHN|nr:hypothetical protein [Altericroceibacterium endophyticum]MXO66903.1 hypothetical protein [Altericroceibacterium endophyticum]
MVRKHTQLELSHKALVHADLPRPAVSVRAADLPLGLSTSAIGLAQASPAMLGIGLSDASSLLHGASDPAEAELQLKILAAMTLFWGFAVALIAALV